MAYISVTGVSAENRVIKHMPGFDTLAEAQAHATVHNGFAVEEPSEGAVSDWLVDPAAQTVIFSPVPVLPRSSTTQEATTAMRDWIERAEEQIDGGISKGERDSYLAKELEARAWVADNTADTPILSAEAAVTGETMADLTTKVITKANDLRPILGEIAGLRRATEAALLAAAGGSDPYRFDTILDGAIQQAITLAANRGRTLVP
jgi:hypothetical protein